MKERPILFSAPMVRALLDGSKTQTRRVVKPQPDTRPGMNCTRLVFKDRKGRPLLDEAMEATEPAYRSLCPYGQPSDRLWVREAFIHEPADYCWEASVSIPSRPASTVYRADQEGDTRGAGWKPSIHMPRSLSRIDLEVIGVRVERLQDISEEDCYAEGIDTEGSAYNEGENYVNAGSPVPAARWAYSALWDGINGRGPAHWDANPWVWVVEFRRVRP